MLAPRMTPDPRPHALTLHPSCAPGAVRRIEVELQEAFRGALEVSFLLEGDVASLRIPAPRPPERQDGLWRHSCFEVFIAAEGGRYAEINLAPSGDWAAYVFDGYRAGMRPLDLPPPGIEAVVGTDRLALRARLDFASLTYSGIAAPWRVGASAVIEDRAGVLSYWALEHAAEKPDFHHADGFVVALGAPVVP